MNHFCNVDVKKNRTDTGEDYGPITATEKKKNKQVNQYRTDLEHSYKDEQWTQRLSHDGNLKNCFFTPGKDGCLL